MIFSFSQQQFLFAIFMTTEKQTMLVGWENLTFTMKTLIIASLGNFILFYEFLVTLKLKITIFKIIHTIMYKNGNIISFFFL